MLIYFVTPYTVLSLGQYSPLIGQEPVVAICVGCGKSAPPTTPRPTTTEKPETTETTRTTAETTVKTTTTPGTTEAGHCCDVITLAR